MSKTQKYQIDLAWNGNRGAGTMTYTAYDRDFTASIPSKHPIEGSSHPAFRGDKDRYCPEELLLTSLSSCHMLWYLHMCASHEVVVLHYHDKPIMEMEVKEFGNGDIRRALLSPVVIIADPENRDLAQTLHQKAHESCFIAKSLKFQIVINPTIEIG